MVDVHDDDALGCAHLGRSQSNSRRGVHGFEHVIDQLDNFAVDVFDWSSDFAKRRIGIFQDF